MTPSANSRDLWLCKIGENFHWCLRDLVCGRVLLLLPLAITFSGLYADQQRWLSVLDHDDEIHENIHLTPKDVVWLSVSDMAIHGHLRTLFLVHEVEHHGWIAHWTRDACLQLAGNERKEGGTAWEEADEDKKGLRQLVVQKDTASKMHFHHPILTTQVFTIT